MGKYNIAAVVAEFNFDINQMMLGLAKEEAKSRGSEITKVFIAPGVFDMALPIKKLLERDDVDAVVALDYDDKMNITMDDAVELIVKALTQANSVGDTEGHASATKGSEKANGDAKDITFNITKGQTTVKNDLAFNLHVGADADMTNKINVNISTMDSKGLGIGGINVKDDSGMAATYAVDAIADAISTVSAQRSALGAVQNRLEHTINNLDNVVENTTSAESRIRDTDMAEEMVEYSKNNILAQAGQSMLAQANQSNQGVLSLLG